MSIIPGKLLKIGEVAGVLNVSRSTVWLWIQQGKIVAIRLPNGRYRIPESEVFKILQIASRQEA